ncbi:hypothetical protein AK830_g12011 [Neonectria ditissima]|uniref:Uncharacterized protein n=1 Tax=Neonectria ditissima TaxID=78410 RepID=A0A0P7B1B1_9HYPO|nr:hypothetical protein AK830_g12011 [Neonectria ditissima]
MPHKLGRLSWNHGLVTLHVPALLDSLSSTPLSQFSKRTDVILPTPHVRTNTRANRCHEHARRFLRLRRYIEEVIAGYGVYWFCLHEQQALGDGFLEAPCRFRYYGAGTTWGASVLYSGIPGQQEATTLFT